MKKRDNKFLQKLKNMKDDEQIAEALTHSLMSNMEETFKDAFTSIFKTFKAMVYDLM